MADEKKSDDAVADGSQSGAGTYARALLGAAEKAGAADQIVGELSSWVDDVLAKNKQLDGVLSSSMVDPAEKHRMLDRAIGPGAKGLKAHPVLLKFLKVMANHGRLGITRAVRNAAQAQLDTLRGRVEVLVTTASLLPESQTAALRDRLRTLLGGEPVVETKVDPQVIGGLIVRVGDNVYDGSVATNLARLREQLINRSVHEIQRRRDSFSSAAGN